MCATDRLVPVPRFVRPIRIPENVECQVADPPVARAGERGRWLLRFILSEAVPGGTELRLLFHGGRNVKGAWQGIQIDNPRTEGFVAVRRRSGEPIGPLAMQAPGEVSFQAPAAGLAKDGCLEVLLGDQAGIVAPELTLPSKMFLLFVPLPPEASRAPSSNPEPPKRIAGACLIHVIGGDLDHLRVYAPSQVQTGQPFNVLVRPEDRFGNVASQRPGELHVQNGDESVSVGRRADSDASSCCMLEGRVLDDPGVFRLTVEDRANELIARSNPIRCVENLDALADLLLWGMIHGHTETSDGTGSLDHYFAYMRDDCLLDFGAPGDHDHVFETSDEMWRMTQEATCRYDEPGRFVTFLGYEWAKWRRNGDGDRNVYFLDDHRPLYRSDEGHCPTPADLFAALQGETALIIPHHSANAGNFCDWKDHDPEKERLVEIFSVWGSSERSVHQGNLHPIRPQAEGSPDIDAAEVQSGFVQKALELGWRVGFTAGGDDHQAHPGDETQRGTPPWRWKAGLMAVRASAKTREAIWDGLWRRNCYGTTGPRIIVSFSLDGSPMGSELTLGERPELADRRTLSVAVHGTAPIEKIEVVRNNIDVYTHRGSCEDASFEWEDRKPLAHVALLPAKYWATPFCFYYVRVTQADREMAWASPIWISP